MAEVRRATLEDVPACADIVDAWVEASDWLPRAHSREDFAEMIALSLPDREFWVAGTPVAGYLSFNPEARQIMGFYTARPGSGVGKLLLDHVKRGRDYIQLWTHVPNTAAHRFYAREGFVEVERDPVGSGQGVAELRMEWRRDA